MTTHDGSSSRPWFAVKSHGYGCGLPISWQGWACLIAFMVAAPALPLLFDPVLAIALVLLLTVGFIWLSARKSDAPWRWRSGERD